MPQASRSPASTVLAKGVEILDPVMNRHGFQFVRGVSGTSSGGQFANGEYVKADRKLEIHFRDSLGLITYHIGTDQMRHEVYMRALLGKDGGNRYPGFSDDPIDAFRDLSADLGTYCSDFLEGDGEVFKRCLAEARRAKKLSPLERLDARWPGCTAELS